MEFVQKLFSILISMFKGLTGLIRGEVNEDAAKKVGKLLAVGFVAISAINTVAAIHKAKKAGRWH